MDHLQPIDRNQSAISGQNKPGEASAFIDRLTSSSLLPPRRPLKMSIPQATFSAAASAALLFLFLLHAATADPVHDILPKFGLPAGLVPDSVTGYSLSDDGEFEIQLAQPCYVKFTDLVYYDKKITGQLSYGAITNLSGIQVKKFFLWLSITGMKAVDSKDIEFQVGFTSETLPVTQFEDVPTCKAHASMADLLIGASVPEIIYDDDDDDDDDDDVSTAHAYLGHERLGKRRRRPFQELAVEPHLVRVLKAPGYA
ncbi:hypothetical protein ACLOJK_021058 [Asimina triloba]